MYFHTFNRSILKSKPAFYLIMIAAHGIALWYACVYGNIFTKDSYEYLNQAINLSGNASWYCGNFSETHVPELYSQRPPLYGIFILLVKLISEKSFLLLLFQNIISLFNIYILSEIIRHQKIKLHPFFIIIALAFFPSQIIYANMIMSEILLQFFVMLAVYFFLLYIRNGNNNHMWLFQFSIASAILTKPVFIAFPVLTLFIVFFIPELRRKKLAIYSHLIPVAVILLVSFNNFHNTGYFEYSSIARKLSVNYNAFYSSAFNNGEEKAIAEIEKLEKEAMLQPTYAAKAQILQSGAGKIIGLNLDAFTILSAKGFFNFFIDHSRYDIDQFAGKAQAKNSGLKDAWKNSGWKGVAEWINSANPIYFIYLTLSMFFHFILLVGLLRFCLISKIPVASRLLIAGTIIYVALLTGMTGTTRFRMPVFLLLLIANLLTLEYFRFPYLKKRKVQEQE